jgi:hypothetical protein
MSGGAMRPAGLHATARCAHCGRVGVDVAVSVAYGGPVCSECFDATAAAVEQGDRAVVRGDRGDRSGDRLSRTSREQSGGPLVLAGDRPASRVRWGEDALASLALSWGAGADGSFQCPLPGHEGRATIGVPDDGRNAGEPRLRCCRGRWRSLGETRAAIAYGEDRKRSNIEIATWTRRLAAEHRAFSPVDVSLPPLTAGSVPPSAQRARDGFALLVGLRWADGEPRPVAWSVRFSCAWCGFAIETARKTTEILIAERVIVEAERRGALRLFLPGRPPAAHAVTDRNGSSNRGASARTLAELTDTELLAIFPGAELEIVSSAERWRMA